MGKLNDGIKKFFSGKSGKYKKIILILLLDVGLGAAAFAIAASIVFFNGRNIDGFINFYHWGFRFLTAGVFIAITILLLVALDCYNTVWRYAGRVEFFKIIIAYFASTGALFLFWVIMTRSFRAEIDGIVINSGFPIPVELIIMYQFLSLLFTLFIRFSYGIRNFALNLRNRFSNATKSYLKLGFKNPPKNTLIIGAGESGKLFLERAFSNPEEGLLPIAFIDEDEDKHGIKIRGVTVVGNLGKLEHTMKKYNIETIVVAIVSLSKAKLKELYTLFSKFNVPVKLMSGIKDANDNSIIGGSLALRDVKVEELLGRDEFKVDMNLLDGAVKDKIVLVTGGAGSIGSELCRQALDFGCKHLIVFDMHENGVFELNEEFKNKYEQSQYSLVVGSVREINRLNETFNKYKPDIVFHAAAYKHVPMMEISPSEAVKNNVFGTLNAITAAKAAGVDRFVFISTDKAVNPANVMGATKRIAEMIVETEGKNSKMHLAAVRFGNVLGSNGSVIPIFLKQINNGGPITLTHKEIKRYFMTIPEAVRLVLQTGSMAKDGEVFVLDMGEPVYIYDLACDLIRFNGLVPEEDIKIEVTGLRPGEKMFEELSYGSEDVNKTVHSGIFVTKMEKINQDTLKQNLNKLEKAALSGNENSVTDIVFSVVPRHIDNKE